MGYVVSEVYADEGISGKSTKNRLAYQRMMQAAREENRFDVVVIWKLTRLGRNMLDILKTVEELLKHNIGLYSISEQFDVTTSSGKLMLQLLGSFGEFERNQISENVQMSMKSLVRDQKRYAGGRRLGYKSGKDQDGNKQLIVVDEEAEIVRMIYLKYLAGNGYRAIANFLNHQGYKTVKGNSFSTIAVKDILRNKVYSGYLEYARYENWDTKRRKGKNATPILVKGSHVPIIDKETYEAVQSKMKKETQTPKWNHSGENVLTGLLRCPECGSAMAASNVTNTLRDGTKKRIRYYSCSRFRNQGAAVCHANSIRADYAEQFVSNRLKEVVQVPEILNQLISDLNKELQEQVRPMEQELAVLLIEQEAIEKKIKKWEEAMVGEDSIEMNQTILDRINQLTKNSSELKVRELEISNVLNYQGEKVSEKDVRAILLGLEKLVGKSSKRELKELYRLFIDRIEFDQLNKQDIKIYMKFDETIITQLNKKYEEVVSQSDTTSFCISGPIKMAI